MEAYLRDNVTTIEDCYVGPQSSKRRYAFNPKLDVVKGQMVIVQSSVPYCVISLRIGKG